jgi:hypothetical protein
MSSEDDARVVVDYYRLQVVAHGSPDCIHAMPVPISEFNQGQAVLSSPITSRDSSFSTLYEGHGDQDLASVSHSISYMSICALSSPFERTDTLKALAIRPRDPRRLRSLTPVAARRPYRRASSDPHSVVAHIRGIFGNNFSGAHRILLLAWSLNFRSRISSIGKLVRCSCLGRVVQTTC